MAWHAEQFVGSSTASPPQPTNPTSRWKKPLTRTTVLGLIALALSSSVGCSPTRVRLDGKVPYRVSKPATVWVWARLPDNRLAEVPMAVEIDDYVMRKELLP